MFTNQRNAPTSSFPLTKQPRRSGARNKGFHNKYRTQKLRLHIQNQFSQIGHSRGQNSGGQAKYSRKQGPIEFESVGAINEIIRETALGHADRLMSVGEKALTDAELMELLFFDSDDSQRSRVLVETLIGEFGGLAEVLFASEFRLNSLEGVSQKDILKLQLTRAFAVRLAQAKVLNRNVITCWADLISYCRIAMSHREKEHFRILFLNRKNVLINDEEQTEGTVDHVPVYPREVAKRALELNASALILVHNHPSGDPEPSNADVLMTQSIANACEAIGVTIHDHVIIGDASEFSFKRSKLL